VLQVSDILKNISVIIKKSGENKVDLSIKYGKSRSYFSEILNGKMKFSLEALIWLANELDIEISEFFNTGYFVNEPKEKYDKGDIISNEKLKTLRERSIKITKLIKENNMLKETISSLNAHIKKLTEENDKLRKDNSSQ